MPSMFSGHRVLPAVALAALAALIAAPGASALEWGTHQTLSAAGELTSSEPSVAMDAGGDAIAAWNSVANQEFECPCSVQVASRTAGAGFGKAVTIANTADEGNPAYVSDVRTAMDSAGDAIVVWDAAHVKQLGEIGGLADDVYAAYRPAGGSFGTPQKLSSEGQHSDGGGDPQVVMDSAGDATIAWISGLGWFEEEPEPRLQMVRRAAGGGFASPQALAGSGSDGPFEFELATSPDGHTAIGFSDEAPKGCSPAPCDPFENGAYVEVRVTIAGPGGAFKTPVAISPKVTSAGTGQGPTEEITSVAIDDEGDAIADYDEVGAGYLFESSRKAKFVSIDSAGSPGSPVGLGASGKTFPQGVAIGPNGEATATWFDSNGFEAAYRPAAGSFGSPQTISAEGFGRTLASGSSFAAGNGDLLAPMVLEPAENSYMVAAALRPAGAGFEAPAAVETVPGGGEPSEPEAAIDAAGDSAALVWGYYGSGTIRAALTGINPVPEEGGQKPPGGGPGPSEPAPAPIKKRTLKCKKGFKKKKVHGKAKCVKVKKKKKRRHHG